MESRIGGCLAGGVLLAASGLCALFALASLVSYPAPFVLVAFSISALPFWWELGPRATLSLVAIFAALAAVLPLALLIRYGADDGGVSGFADILIAGLLLYCAAAIASAIGMLLGRAVWAPAKPIVHP